MIDIGDNIAVDTVPAPHALLGEALAIRAAGAIVTHMSVVDWARPAEIPTVAEPSRLPLGAGARILNALAERAAAAGIAALRYAGPYPTPALWRALARSFRAPAAASEAEFIADFAARAARVARDPIAIDFQPAPHRHVAWPARAGWSEVRDGVERVVVAALGVGFERDGSPARLVALADGACVAELWFGDRVYARIAEVDATGELRGEPSAPPPLTSSAIGQAFPRQLCAALAELVADSVPAPLADAARARVASSQITWADLGARAARFDRARGGFEVHAALWERITPLGIARLALAIAEALAPVVTTAVIAELAA